MSAALVSSWSPASAASSAPTSPPGWPPIPASNGSSASTPHAPAPELAALLDGVEQVRADAAHRDRRRRRPRRRGGRAPRRPTAPDPQHGGRAAMKEQNVIGTMQLLAACQQAPPAAQAGGALLHRRVRRVVPRPGRLHRGHRAPRGAARRRSPATSSTSRGTSAASAAAAPTSTATVLRFAPFIGSTADTTLTRYFAQPVVPTVLGRDPRLQFMHVDDALEVLHRSVVEDHPGTFNVAGAGVLALSQAIRRAGRVAVPVLEPGLSVVAALAAQRRRRPDRPGPGRPLRARPGGRHHAGWSGSTASRRAPPRRRSTTSSAATPAVPSLTATSWPPPSGRSSTASGGPRVGHRTGRRDEP